MVSLGRVRWGMAWRDLVRSRGASLGWPLSSYQRRQIRELPIDPARVCRWFWGSKNRLRQNRLWLAGSGVRRGRGRCRAGTRL